MKTLIFTATILLGSLSFAAKPYGEAGCGLGSVLMGPQGNQVLAATTNGSSYTNLFGISSGTSNCVQNGTVALNKEIPLFIDVNKDSLAREAAKGSGEMITGLSHLLGCSETALGPVLQSNFRSIFVDTKMDASSIQGKIENLLAKDNSICGA